MQDGERRQHAASLDDKEMDKSSETSKSMIKILKACKAGHLIDIYRLSTIGDKDTRKSCDTLKTTFLVAALHMEPGATMEAICYKRLLGIGDPKRLNLLGKG